MVSTQKLLEQIKSGEIIVRNIYVSENDYGEWVFIYIDNGFFVSLFGYKYSLESWVNMDGFKYNIGNSSDDIPVDYDKVKGIIEAFKKEVDEQIKKQDPPSEYAKQKNALFELFSEVGDSDGAKAELEDMGMW